MKLMNRVNMWVNTIDCAENFSLMKIIFFTYFRMSRDCFEELHQILEPKILKTITNWRKKRKERLTICLR
jgi:hypothetical protein